MSSAIPCSLSCVLVLLATTILTARATSLASSSSSKTTQRTCPYSCQSDKIPLGAGQSEKFGESSRCFATRLDTTAVVEHQCFAVSCLDGACKDEAGWTDEKGYGCSDWVGFDCADVTRWGYSQAGMNAVLQTCKSTCGLCKYTVRLSDGAASTCSGTGAWIEFSGWQGQVFCDSKAEVCTSGDDVVPTREEARRTEVQTYLRPSFPTAASDLLIAYDKGKFSPHLPS